MAKSATELVTGIAAVMWNVPNLIFSKCSVLTYNFKICLAL